MSEVTSRRPAPPVAYPKDRTRPDLADHAHFYFSHVGRFRRTNHPFFGNSFPANLHLLLPICCRVSCGQGPWTPGVIGLPPGRLSVATHVLSVRLGSHPLRDEIEAIATASRKPTLTPRSPDRSYGNQGLGMVFPEYTSALCRIFGSWRSGRLRLENETARRYESLCAY